MSSDQKSETQKAWEMEIRAELDHLFQYGESSQDSPLTTMIRETMKAHLSASLRDTMGRTVAKQLLDLSSEAMSSRLHEMEAQVKTVVNDVLNEEFVTMFRQALGRAMQDFVEHMEIEVFTRAPWRD